MSRQLHFKRRAYVLLRRFSCRTWSSRNGIVKTIKVCPDISPRKKWDEWSNGGIGTNLFQVYHECSNFSDICVNNILEVQCGTAASSCKEFFLSTVIDQRVQVPYRCFHGRSYRRIHTQIILMDRDSQIAEPDRVKLESVVHEQLLYGQFVQILEIVRELFGWNVANETSKGRGWWLWFCLVGC